MSSREINYEFTIASAALDDQSQVVNMNIIGDFQFNKLLFSHCLSFSARTRALF